MGKHSNTFLLNGTRLKPELKVIVMFNYNFSIGDFKNEIHVWNFFLLKYE
jgi:hypothetical protein